MASKSVYTIIDVDKISSAIDSLSVGFFSVGVNNNPSKMMMSLLPDTFAPDIALRVIVSTGVSEEGFFWVQPICHFLNVLEIRDEQKMKRNHQRANLYIDEVCKNVRMKWIGDDSWRTFDKLKRFPESMRISNI